MKFSLVRSRASIIIAILAVFTQMFYMGAPARAAQNARAASNGDGANLSRGAL